MPSDQSPRVFESGLRACHCRHGAAIVLYAPDGHRIALTPQAVARSAEALRRAAREAAAMPGTASKVVALHPLRSARPLRRRWQTARVYWQRVRHGDERCTRLMVAGILAPIAWAMIAGAGALLLALLPAPSRVVAGLPFLVLGALLLAPPFAYLAAPLLMDRDERRPPLRSGPRPILMVFPPREEADTPP